MDIKQCGKCRQTKPVGEFNRQRSRKDGLQNYCRECASELKRERYHKDPEASIKRAREWNIAHRERYVANLKRWEEANPDRKRELRTRSHQRHRDSAAERSKRYRERYPEKARAREALHNAVREGKIAKPLACECCGGQPPRELIHGHHEDYSKPLEVEWLCRTCHWERHGKGSLSV